MKKVRREIRVTQASTAADMILRLYKDAVAQNPDSALARDQNLAAMMASLEGLSGELTTAIKREKISTSLDEADLARDKLIGRLFAVLAGYAAMPFEEKQIAAEKILAVTAKYKGIANETYANESALLASMLEDLSAADLASSIDQLDGVGILISDLRDAEDNFKRESVSATKINASKGDSAVKIKKPLLSVINEEIVPYLTGLAKVEAYQAFITHCEAEINRANQSVNRKKASEAEETVA